VSAVIGNPLLLGPEGYQISRSVRLRSSASAYFNRTPASASDQKKWTFSAWVKRGQLGTTQIIAQAGTSGTTFTYIAYFNSSDQLVILDSTVSGVSSARTSAAVFRDPSAWYHIVVNLDAANSVCNGYVNGVAQTFTGTQPSNQNWAVNSAIEHRIGRAWATNTSYFDGYLTEINFIDGQALTPSSFGENDTVTGVWKPKKYAGTYGTNGFYLNFSDNSNNTAATIGKDYSGNGNNWTPNNISVTSGTTYDSMIDVPTSYADGGNGRGNYAVLNRVNQTTYGSLSDGNLKLSGATDWGGFPSSIPIPKTGKWYAEFVLGSTSSNSAQADCGIFPVGNTMYYNWSNSYGLEVNNGFFLITNGSFSSNRGSTTAGGTVFQIAVDADSGKVWFGVNNAWYDTYNTTNGDPSAGTNPSGSGINFDSTTYQMAVKTDFNNWTANFGQRPFTYTPPTGFKALNTQNLPDSTIKKGNQYFDATTYTGNGSTQSIVNSGGMQPDLVWYKSRGAARDHSLFDSVRGATNQISSNATYAESAVSGVTAFNSNGFSLGSSANGNNSSESYVGWQWKKGATQGFDIVTCTTNGSGIITSTSHALGVTPSMILLKARTGTDAWYVYHKNSTATATQGTLNLNTTSAVNTTNGSSGGVDKWTVSSSAFAAGNSLWTYQANTNHIAYLFSEVAGFSKFGSYTGNGSADGPFVYCGFRPRFILYKSATSVTQWVLLDTARNTYNVSNLYLFANASDAEGTFTLFDITSNGFKVRTSNSTSNGNGDTYIYMAFAENPFKNSLAR